MLILLILQILILPTARAENALQAMGKAYQEQYYTVKKLKGPVNRAQMDSINRRIFSRPNAMMAKVNTTKQIGMMKALSAARSDLQEELNAARKDAKVAKSKGMTLKQYRRTIASAGGAKKPGQPGETATGRGAAPSLRNSTTGEVTGSDGAKSVEFGDRQKEQPNYKVIDGIIQDQ